jgi:L-ornithine N5-oxygenase
VSAPGPADSDTNTNSDTNTTDDDPLDAPEILDIVGIGFGPSNLALAIAVEEHNEQVGHGGAQRPLTATFLERQGCFGWHRGMLLDDATMQVSFLKDLVTMRNPCSEFSFLAYLQSRGRLAEFINHKILFPLRIEFHDYLEWAAERVRHAVAYDQRVVEVEPVVTAGRVVAFDVASEDAVGGRRVHRARNVAVAVGLTPSLPFGATLSGRVWHNLDLLPRAEAFPRRPEPRRFVVVGAGQSAAEAVAYLHAEFRTAEVCSVFTRYGYAPSDDTPFANRIFDPQAVDVYFDADDDVKRMLFDYHRNTNYSVVDAELIEELYQREYRERVLGNRRLRMMNASRVIAVDETGDDTGGGLRVSVESLPSGRVEELDADALVYATGYQPADTLRLLGGAGELVERRHDGTPVVHRDYRLGLDRPGDAAIYVQGGTEHSHGISSSLLSNVAVRTGEIVTSIAARAAGLQPAPCPSTGEARSSSTVAGGNGSALGLVPPDDSDGGGEVMQRWVSTAGAPARS